MQINTYLNFSGQCEEAFKFYEKLLGGKIGFMMTFRGSPAESQVPADWADKVLHVRLETPAGVLVGSDRLPGRKERRKEFFVPGVVDEGPKVNVSTGNWRMA